MDDEKTKTETPPGSGIMVFFLSLLDYKFTSVDLIFAFLLAINIYLVTISILATRNKSQQIHPPSDATLLRKPDHILLVIAHPDDEAMFFVPTIHTLVQEAHSNVYILCLSTGNFDGLGSVRTEELYASAKVLNVANTNVKIINDPTLQDGKHQVWSKEDVAKQVSACVDRWPINKIITFDDYGVSGHENHRDTSRGVVYFYETSKWGRTNGGSSGGGGGGGGGGGDSLAGNNNENNLYVLESTHLCRKYTGVLDVLTSLVQEGSQCFCSLTPWINYAAMQAHFSQFVWYRRLFVLFSRYTYVNNLIKQQRPVGAKKESGAEELNKDTKKTK